MASERSRSADEPRFAGIKLGQGLCNNGEVGFCDRVIKANQEIAGLHPIAVPDQQFADHAAGGMLDLFDVGFDDDCARRNQRAGYFGCCCPDADAARQERGRRQCRQSYSAELIQAR